MIKSIIAKSRLYDALFPTDEATLKRIIEGTQDPDFLGKVGRTAILRLEHPIILNNQKITALKIKGIGLCDFEGRITPPTVEGYSRIHPHLAFTPEGDFTLLTSAPDVAGGITTTRAKREYANSDVLHTAGTTSAVPIALYQIEGKEFETAAHGAPEQLAVVVTGIPATVQQRLDLIFDKDLFSDPEKKKIYTSWLPPETEINEQNRFKNVRSIFKAAGQQLRAFHDAGLFRYSGHLENFGVHMDGTQRVYLTDLDSTIPLAGNTTRANAALYIMRDISSLAYGLIKLSTRRDNIGMTREHIDQIKPLFKAAIEGYFHEVSTEKVDKFSQCLALYFEHILQEAEQRHKKTQIGNDDPIQMISNVSSQDYKATRRTLREETWLDRFEIYPALLCGTAKLYRDCDLNKKYELTASDRTLNTKMQEFIASQVGRGDPKRAMDVFAPLATFREVA